MMAHGLLIVVGEKVDKQLKPFKDKKFDWYEVGGGWDGYFRLKIPKQRGFIARIFGASPIVNVNQARKSEVDVKQVKKGCPVAILVDEQFHEIPIAYDSKLHNPNAKKWRKKFFSLFDKVKDDVLLTAIDYHN